MVLRWCVTSSILNHVIGSINPQSVDIEANCNALPGFVPYGSGGDGSDTQYCESNDSITLSTVGAYSALPFPEGFVGYDPTFFNAIVVGHQVSFFRKCLKEIFANVDVGNRSFELAGALN